MIVACPSCGTRYSIADSQIGEGGRAVRCTRCGHQWRQDAVDDGDGLADGIGERVPEPETPDPPEEEPDDGSAGSVSLLSRAGEDDDDEAEAPPTLRARQPVGDDDDEEASGGGWLRWLVLLAILIGLGAGGYVYRLQVVTVWPPSQKLYDLAGIEVDVPGLGLEIRDVRSERATQTGKPVLIVNGEIVNIARKSRAVPRLRVALSDDQGRELVHWTVQTAANALAAGAVAAFSTRLENPPDAARKLAVTFILPDAE